MLLVGPWGEYCGFRGLDRDLEQVWRGEKGQEGKVEVEG
jgi:hypothetical protein